MALSGQGTISIEWCLVVLTLNLVILRLVNRLLIQRDRINIGDILLIFAWMALSSLAACDTWLLKLGLLDPKRTYNDNLIHLSRDPAKRTQILKLIYGTAIPFYVALWLAKGALLSFLYTVIPPSIPIYRKALHGVTGAVLMTLIVVLCVNLFWCMPTQLNWTLTEENACFSFFTLPVSIISTACDILTNIAILILPFPLFRNTKIQRRSQMLFLIAMFSLGSFTMLASVVRVATLADTATTTHVAVWSSVEAAIGLTVATLPSLRTLIRRRPDSLSPSSGSGCSDRKPNGRPNRPDWICLEEAYAVNARNKNRDTIKSHSTVLTVPTIEELEDIVCEKEGTPPVRSINELQRFHDSALFNRDPTDISTGPNYEWSFDKVQWRYTDPLPPSPITVNGLGVIPDITSSPAVAKHLRDADPAPPVPPLPVLLKHHYQTGLR